MPCSTGAAAAAARTSRPSGGGKGGVQLTARDYFLYAGDDDNLKVWLVMNRTAVDIPDFKEGRGTLLQAAVKIGNDRCVEVGSQHRIDGFLVQCVWVGCLHALTAWDSASDATVAATAADTPLPQCTCERIVA